MIYNKLYFVAIAAGISEFLAACLLFLMTGFTLTGYFTASRLAALNFGKDVVSRAGLVLGVFAFFGFLIGLAGSVSALERRRWVLSIIGSLTTSFWGVLFSFYTMLALSSDAASASVGYAIGYTVILLSGTSGLLVILSRHEFLRTKT